MAYRVARSNFRGNPEDLVPPNELSMLAKEAHYVHFFFSRSSSDIRKKIMRKVC
jgi:hypothetical protein